jgi:hypothetical protein
MALSIKTFVRSPPAPAAGCLGDQSGRYRGLLHVVDARTCLTRSGPQRIARDGARTIPDDLRFRAIFTDFVIAT